MFKIILTVLVLAVAVVLALATTKPDRFRVERRITIKAAPERIYAQIVDFKAWRNWSPWENLDPQLKRTYAGADQGVGASYAWEGNSKVGSGRMEIIAAEAPSRIDIRLEFLKPIRSGSNAVFTLTPHDGATEVVWQMDGPTPFVSKIMQVFMNMERMIGGSFESGLADLKRVSEQP